MRSLETRDKKCLGCDALILRKSLRCYSCSCKKNNTGRAPWNKGKKGVQKAWNLGIRHSVLTKEKIRVKAIGRKVSDETRKKLSLMRKGEKSILWKGGITPINQKIRSSFEMQVWRKSIFERDKYTCVWCGQIGGKLNADHIKPFSVFPELRFELSNGRTLCVECHKKTDTWQKKALNYKK